MRSGAHLALFLSTNRSIMATSILFLLLMLTITRLVDLRNLSIAEIESCKDVMNVVKTASYFSERDNRRR